MAKNKNVAYNQEVELCGRKFYSEIKNGHARGNDYIMFTIGLELKNGAKIFCKKGFFGYNSTNIQEAKSFIYHNYKICMQAHESQHDIYVKVKSNGTFAGLTTYNNKINFDFDFIDIIDKNTSNSSIQKIIISGYVENSYDNILEITSGEELAKIRSLKVEIDKTLKNNAKLGHVYVLQGELVKALDNEEEFSWDTEYEEREELIVTVKPIGIKRGFFLEPKQTNSIGKVEELKAIVENKEEKIKSRISITNSAF